MGGLPSSKDARKCIEVLEKEFGWSYSDSVGNSAHVCGRLECGDGCKVKVYKTGDNTAKALWREARRCPHQHNPPRVKW